MLYAALWCTFIASLVFYNDFFYLDLYMQMNELIGVFAHSLVATKIYLQSPIVYAASLKKSDL
jgi:hypothetical protein